MSRFFKIKQILISVVASFPLIAFAQPKDFKSLIQLFINYIIAVIPIVMGLTVLFFFWGIVKYIFAAGNEEKRKDAKYVMTWGLLALFFMTSVLAIVAMVGDAVFPDFKIIGNPRDGAQLPGYGQLPEGANVGE